jgi:asparagine synthase (glutamine-hydrolysing)
MPDELEAATAIAAAFGAEHTPVLVERDAAFRRLPHVVWATDDLLRDYACLPTSFLSQAAAAELKVVLTGEGGDEVFAGYGRYRPAPFERLAKALIAPGSGGFRTRGHWRRRWTRQVFGPDLLALGRAARRPFIAAWASTPRGWSDLQRRQYTDLITNLPDDLLVKADRVLMSFGLEGRVPLLDHRLVEFGLALPDELKVGRQMGKVLLRRWAERRLPTGHLLRPKRGFHVPVGEWLRGHVLRRLGRSLPGALAVRRWLRAEGVRALIEAQHRGARTSRELWGVLQFAIWHRIFIEAPGSTPGFDEDPTDWVG